MNQGPSTELVFSWRPIGISWLINEDTNLLWIKKKKIRKPASSSSKHQWWGVIDSVLFVKGQSQSKGYAKPAQLSIFLLFLTRLRPCITLINDLNFLPIWFLKLIKHIIPKLKGLMKRQRSFCSSTGVFRATVWGQNVIKRLDDAVKTRLEKERCWYSMIFCRISDPVHCSTEFSPGPGLYNVTNVDHNCSYNNEWLNG